ncbi:MAG: glycosyltransferase [Acidobacteriota bacterium]
MSANPVSEITAILVSWRDADDLEEAVRSLSGSRREAGPVGPRVSLVAVGNGPGSVRRERIETLWPGATVVENAENRGFGPAANQGASAARGDVLLFLNPDTRAEGDPFAALARGLDLHPEAVAMAPRLLDPDGAARGASARALAPPGDEDQFTFQLRRLPRLPSDARELLLWDHLFPSGGPRRRARYADEDRDRPFPVEQAAGAALAVRASVFRRIGGFDEAFRPAWFEDVDLCARLLGEGAILYWPDARFRHAGGVSSARLGYDRFLPILYANALRYRAKHYPLAARAAYRGLLGTGMLLRLILLPLRRRMPRARSEAARAYARVLLLLAGANRGRAA